MLRRLLVLGAALAVLAAPAAAQSTAAAAKKATAAKAVDQTPPAAPTPPSPPSPPAPPAPPVPPRRGQPINVKIEVVITDQHGSAAATKKSLSVIVGDQQTGSIRSAINIPGNTLPLNVDATPEIQPDGKIRLRFGLDYDLPPEGQLPSGPDRLNRSSLRENVALILENGKPLLVTQSADPIGDRQVMVELKATVLK